MLCLSISLGREYCTSQITVVVCPRYCCVATCQLALTAQWNIGADTDPQVWSQTWPAFILSVFIARSGSLLGGHFPQQCQNWGYVDAEAARSVWRSVKQCQWTHSTQAGGEPAHGLRGQEGPLSIRLPPSDGLWSPGAGVHQGPLPPVGLVHQPQLFCGPPDSQLHRSLE